MLWTIIVIVFVLWLLGAFGGKVFSGFPKVGGWIHILIAIAVILLILKLLGAI
ncbi:MAG: lmo0937 family membrane protein [Bacillota bacterium]|nr:lmo0937 family membrane protein [Bacillota bacterium]